MSSDSGVIRRAKRLIKGTAYISTTEYEKFPDREQQGLGVRQDAEQVSRSSVRSFSITVVLNRTELAGQPSRFGQITHFAHRFGLRVVSGSRAGRPNFEFNRLSPICHCCYFVTVGRKAALR